MTSRHAFTLLALHVASCVAISLACTLPARAADELVYRSPAGVSFRITAAGLSSIKFANREIASGGWSALNAESWFKDGGAGLVKSAKSEQSITVLDEHHARVRQAGGDVVCTFDYSFDGEDVTISTRVENSNSSSPMNITGFSGLTFRFQQPPTGLMPVQHISYFQAHGVQLCHPGYWQPIGGTYACDDSIGVGTSPWNTGLMRTLTLWDYGDWNADKREKFPERGLRYFVVSPVPPRGSATFDFVLRVSPDRDWKHLLGKYREHFQKTFGPVQYKSDARVIGTDYLNQDQKAISPANPYGFHAGPRRIDTAEGVKLFCDTYIPPLKQANGQGIIVWGQGGEDPRGGMYRPDFDVLPPEVEANWPTIASRFKEAGLKIGVATRPRDMAVKLDWKSDQIISINPDDPGHREMLWRRFDRMQKHGCTLFYLDSFGDSFEDVKLMRHLRERLGPDVLTFCEHQCDAMMPYSGGYSETTFDAERTVAEIQLVIDRTKLRKYQITVADVAKAISAANLRSTPGEPAKDDPPYLILDDTPAPTIENVGAVVLRFDRGVVFRVTDVATIRSVPKLKPAQFRLWSGGQNWEIYQWLCPGAQMSARLYEVHGNISPEHSPDAWYFAHHVTPLIPTNDFHGRLGDAKAMQEKYLKGDGTWKE